MPIISFIAVTCGTICRPTNVVILTGLHKSSTNLLTQGVSIVLLVRSVAGFKDSLPDFVLCSQVSQFPRSSLLMLLKKVNSELWGYYIKIRKYIFMRQLEGLEERNDTVGGWDSDTT